VRKAENLSEILRPRGEHLLQGGVERVRHDGSWKATSASFIDRDIVETRGIIVRTNITSPVPFSTFLATP
jgi:hypothetical protein